MMPGLRDILDAATPDEPFVTLAALMERDDLPSVLADVLIACALKRDDEPTPHEVARQAAKTFGWSEQTWRETVRPHILARLDRIGKED